MIKRLPRSLKDDVIILRKCPWGAMTGEDYDIF